MTEALPINAGVIVMSQLSSRPPPLIACCNASEDIVELLADVLQLAGFRTVTDVSPASLGPDPTIAFLRQVQPQACVYSVPLPHEESWRIFLQVRAALPDCGWVVTTTNKRALEALVGPTPSIEVWGKPFNIDDIVSSVRRVLADGEPACT